MKNKIDMIIVGLIITFLMSLCIPIYSSYATTNATVYLKANKEVIEEGDEVEIGLYIQGQKTAAYNATIYFDESKYEWISGPENTKVEGNQIKLLWYDIQGGSGSKQNELGKIVLKAKEEGLSNFVIEGDFYTPKEQHIQADFKTIQVQIGKEETNLQKQAKEEQGTNIQSDNANLQSLRINKEGLVPNFETDVYNYDLIVDKDTVDLEVLAIPENAKALVEITGNTRLQEGINSIKIKVTSENSTQYKEYEIKVTKTANIALANTNLEILAIENTLLTPPFGNQITQYNTQISNDITNLNILAIPENEMGKVQITGNKDLKEGNNTIIITVTAPNEITKRQYFINVYKRSSEEEVKYKEEEQKKEEKLEQAYEIEKTSAVTAEGNTNQVKEENRNDFIIGALGIILLGIVVGIYYKKKTEHKNK